jgi:Binding-protein-dependent transport system inner membrane component
VAGVITGFAIGLSTLARGVGITFISALFPIPKIALLPLLILWLGIGEEPKIATIALGVFFSTAISVYSGVDAVPRNLIRMAQSFNVPFHAIVRRVIWPGALPSILAGFRITASVALLLVVSAEMIGAQFGIGAFVLQAGNLMQTRSATRWCRDPVAVRAGGGEGDQRAGSEAAALAVKHGVGWAKRSVPTTLTSARMVGASLTPLCPPESVSSLRTQGPIPRDLSMRRCSKRRSQ